MKFGDADFWDDLILDGLVDGGGLCVGVEVRRSVCVCAGGATGRPREGEEGGVAPYQYEVSKTGYGFGKIYILRVRRNTFKIQKAEFKMKVKKFKEVEKQGKS